jgi:asparagine synthase (glutamine-hydrolysing)
MDASNSGTSICASVISIEEGYGWNKFICGEIELWFKGWIHGESGQKLAETFSTLTAPPTVEMLEQLVSGMNGHFALVVAARDWVVAIVDRVRSVPLAIAKIDGCWAIDDRADRLRQNAGLAKRDIELDAARSIAMAGYTIDKASLYRGLEVLVPGELVIFEVANAPRRHRYYIYQPWKVATEVSGGLEKQLAELTLEVMDRTLSSLDGRPLIVPLSAGNDSRLIASAAKQLGYKDVRCFAYGRSGSYEAKTSAAIAERLGYPWRFVPLTISGQKKFFAGADHAAYVDYCDGCTAVPFVQDMAPIQVLKANGYIPPESVIANGNSGDYISGMHVPPTMHSVDPDLDLESRQALIVETFYDKHFSLWRALRTEANKECVQADLHASITSAGAKLDVPVHDFGVYEYAEFQDRQCKYVISGQRVYEFLGHEWRLPLWDNDYLDFWEKTPLSEKINQSLYVRMLKKENWGSVWQDIPVNRQNLRPLPIVPLRWLAKAIFAPFGREPWYRFQQQYFQYWMEPTCNTAVIPYGTFARDRRGARNSVAWLAEQYLRRHGVSFSELLPREASIREGA